MTPFKSTGLRFENGVLWALDQTLLPHKEVWVSSPHVTTMIGLIKNLQVRGAPLIGIAASLQLGLLAEQKPPVEEFEKALWALRESRPTAVNLMNNLDSIYRVYKEHGLQSVPAEAERLCLEDFRLCQSIADNGLKLFAKGDRVLTHCNSGGLATIGIGTALGAIINAQSKGLDLHVYVDETRPLLQGARLTSWELRKHQVNHTLICDNMAASLMQKGLVDKVIVGADRIARNGDFANKVGTYSLAVLCRFHGLPFYVAAPYTTVDVNCAHGLDIPIEERSAEEVRGYTHKTNGVSWALENVAVYNPAFDVTPESLVSAWVLDHGVYTREDVAKGSLIR